MGSSKKVDMGTRYFVAWHVLLAKRVDAVLEVRAADKVVWSGNVAASTTLAIAKPELFGGDKDQGGMVGNLAVMMGEATQAPNAYLTGQFGDHTVAWRGFTTLAWQGGEYGSNNPYPFKMSAKTFSCHQLWDEPPGWYPETAKVAVGATLTVRTVLIADTALSAANVSGSATVPVEYREVAGLSPSTVVEVEVISGAYTAWSPWPTDSATSNGKTWFCGFKVTRASGVIETHHYGTYYENAAIANAVASSSPLLLTGDTGYRFWISDEVPYDDRGGLSLRVSALAETSDAFAMNPVHIIVHAHTHSEMGRMPMETINDASARAAADWYYAQGFGINVRQRVASESPADLIKRVERVAGLSFTRDMATGQWHFYVANGEYDIASLPILTDDDIIDFKATPTVPDNAVNSVQVKYFDPERKETVSTPWLRALGMVDLYGEIQQTYDYPEIPTGAIANRVALREALGSITPTARFDLVAKPTGAAAGINKGQYFRLQAPKRGIVDMLCLLGSKEGGTLKSGALKLTAAQDVWSLPDAVYSAIDHGIDTRPSQTPLPITEQQAFEVPYALLAGQLDSAALDALPQDAGYLATVAADPGRCRDYQLTIAPDGGAAGDYVDAGSGDFGPTATLAADLGVYLTGPIALAEAQQLAAVALGDAVLLGDEICRVDAIDADAPSITLGRGCADTVPQTHAAGTRLYVLAAGVAAYDTTQRIDGEAVDIKLLTNTGSERLDPAAATRMDLTFDSRAARPYPPRNLQVNGAGFQPPAEGEPPTGGDPVPPSDPPAITGALPAAMVGVPYLNRNDALAANLDDLGVGAALRVRGSIAPGIVIASGPEMRIAGPPLQAGTFAVELQADARNGDFVDYSGTLTVGARPAHGTLDWRTAHVDARMVSMYEAAFAGQAGVLGYGTFGLDDAVIAEFTVTGGDALIGVHAASLDNPTIGTGGNPAGTWAVSVGPGTWQLAAHDGQLWITDGSGAYIGDPAAGTGASVTGLNTALASDGAFRWAVNAAAGVGVVCNFGDSAWVRTPPVGFAGVACPVEAVPAIWDTASTQWCEYTADGAMGRLDFTAPLSLYEHDGMRATLAASAGKRQYALGVGGMATDHIRLGGCGAAHIFGDGTGLGDAPGTFALWREADECVIRANFGGVVEQRIPWLAVTGVWWTFGIDHDAHVIRILRNGTQVHAIGGLPAGAMYPAASMTAVRAAYIRATPPHPIAGFSALEVTP